MVFQASTTQVSRPTHPAMPQHTLSPYQNLFPVGTNPLIPFTLLTNGGQLPAATPNFQSLPHQFPPQLTAALFRNMIPQMMAAQQRPNSTSTNAVLTSTEAGLRGGVKKGSRKRSMKLDISETQA